jgi:hypothetical protein
MVMSILVIFIQPEEAELRKTIAIMLEVPNMKRSWVFKKEMGWVKIKTPERTEWWTAVNAYRDSKFQTKSQILLSVLRNTKESRGHVATFRLLRSFPFDWEGGLEIHREYLLFPPKWATVENWSEFLIASNSPSSRTFIESTVRKHWMGTPSRIKIIDRTLEPFDWGAIKRKDGTHRTPSFHGN